MAGKVKAVFEAATESVVLNVQGASFAAFELEGTFVGTVQFEAMGSVEGTPGSVEGMPISDLDGTGVTEATAPGAWRFDVRGMSRLQARCSAFTSGIINVFGYAE